MERCGPVVNIVVGINKRTGESKGYAFVEFTERKDAEEAYNKYKGYLLEGRPLRVDWDIGMQKKEEKFGYSRPRDEPYSRRSGSRSPRRSAERKSRSPRRRSEERDGKRSPRRHSASPNLPPFPGTTNARYA
eukprot:TRINITY_DN8_c0_g1_i1.p1 TRINITY_DN8_c0_g1~~TRINITY_DN8_c0_g1_i1.p1  ORF type:complete len:132 (-),score=4.11 TRINITY_DN8_c0_g1_i1:3-398(-)